MRKLRKFYSFSMQVTGRMLAKLGAALSVRLHNAEYSKPARFAVNHVSGTEVLRTFRGLCPRARRKGIPLTDRGLSSAGHRCLEKLYWISAASMLANL